jgi:hypothetical protein
MVIVCYFMSNTQKVISYELWPHSFLSFFFWLGQNWHNNYLKAFLWSSLESHIYDQKPSLLRSLQTQNRPHSCTTHISWEVWLLDLEWTCHCFHLCLQIKNQCAQLAKCVLLTSTDESACRQWALFSHRLMKSFGRSLSTRVCTTLRWYDQPHHICC